MQHPDFEKKLMTMLLSGDNPVLAALRYQYEDSSVVRREFTGVGFFTDYQVNSQLAPVLNGRTFTIGDVDASVNGVPSAIGFVLFIKDGFLSMLEGYTNLIDVWPDEYAGIELSYYDGEPRNIQALHLED